MKASPINKARRLLELGCAEAEAQNHTRAAHFYHRSALLGNAEAQVNLANAYDAGEGVPKDFRSARHWYKLAIRKRIPEAAFNLAVAYRTAGNIPLAEFWFHRAKELGDLDAAEAIDSMLNGTAQAKLANSSIHNSQDSAA